MKILPFRGYRYNPEIVGRLDDVISPPYDQFKEGLDDLLFARHPHNMAHLIVNKETATDAKLTTGTRVRAGCWIRGCAKVCSAKILSPASIRTSRLTRMVAQARRERDSSPWGKSPSMHRKSSCPTSERFQNPTGSIELAAFNACRHRFGVYALLGSSQ